MLASKLEHEIQKKTSPHRTRSSFVLRRERDSLAKIYLSVSFELSEIRAPVRGRSNNRLSNILRNKKALCLLKKRKGAPSRNSFLFFAEREGFEPPEPLSSTVFKTAAIDHSAISPLPIRANLVRRMRLELTRSCDHYPLKVACIPISPPALVGMRLSHERRLTASLGDRDSSS